MINDHRKIEHRLSALQGLEWSGVSRAADMLTLGFGPKHKAKNFFGVPKRVSAWALHIRCAWTLSEAGKIIATEESLWGPDEQANAFALSLRQLLARNAPITVESVSANPDCSPGRDFVASVPFDCGAGRNIGSRELAVLRIKTRCETFGD
jgi:hypothetical protein